MNGDRSRVNRVVFWGLVILLVIAASGVMKRANGSEMFREKVCSSLFSDAGATRGGGLPSTVGARTTIYGRVVTPGFTSSNLSPLAHIGHTA